MKKMIVAPSILSADFSKMGQAIQMLNDCKADWVHVDVMDGVFVPNISFGQKMVKDIRPLTELILDVHLMITEPIRYIKEFASCGADIITVHIEAMKNPIETLQAIKNCGKKVGLSIKPNTPVSELKPYLDYLDLILIMSVEPGFGGQKFIENALQKISETKEMIKGRSILIEVDGGVSEENIAAINEAGADAIVAGSAVFKSKEPSATIKLLQNK